MVGTFDLLLRILWVLASAHILLTWLLAFRRGRQARAADTQQVQPKPAALPAVSVIVPAWNESGTIERNIAALQKVEYPCWEVVILAGGEDGTHEAAIKQVAGDERFRILERGPEPKNAALSRGIETARYDVLVLLDCDNIVEQGWLAALIAPLANGASISVGNSFPNRITWVTLEERIWQIYVYQILKLSWIQGDRSIAIRRSVLDRIGGLPEHTYAREDWDIWARLGETGEKVVFAEEARLTTDRPATVVESWKHQVRWRRTHLNGIWEHRLTLLKRPVDLFRQVFGYLLSAGLIVLFLIALSATMVKPAFSFYVWTLLGLTLVWVCGRQAAVAVSVAAYLGDWRWAWRAWMVVFNLFLTIPASVLAILTYRQLNPLYKGPRIIRSK